MQLLRPASRRRRAMSIRSLPRTSPQFADSTPTTSSSDKSLPELATPDTTAGQTAA
jgi:hypothetical protein